MRVVFAGHTGLEKDMALDNLVNHIYAKKGLDANEPGSKGFLALFRLERILEEKLCIESTVSLLETANIRYAVEGWSVAFDQIFQEIERQDPDHVFLSMHFTFHVPGRSTIPYTIGQLSRFRTTHIVTLIDDIYEVQARIRRKNAERGTDYRISLRELAWWRAQEIGMGSWLARNLPASPVERGGQPQPVEHYVVAAKHPIEMAWKLLFEPQVPRVYASFPITSTRDSEDSRMEIDEVRCKLHSLHTVFDPLTIDELSPWILSQADSTHSIELTKGDPRCRWPYPEANLLCSGRPDVYPIMLQPDEVLAVKGDVEHSIRVRDFGLVDVCDHIVGYRPYYMGNFSKGMYAEFNHALNVCRPPIPIHYYFPAEDQADPGPFGQFRTLHQDKDRWWQVVERLTAQRK